MKYRILLEDEAAPSQNTSVLCSPTCERCPITPLGRHTWPMGMNEVMGSALALLIVHVLHHPEGQSSTELI